MSSGAYLVAGVVCLGVGILRGGPVSAFSFVFLGAGAVCIAIAILEAPWPAAHRGPPPDEVDPHDDGDGGGPGVDSPGNGGRS